MLNMILLHYDNSEMVRNEIEKQVNKLVNYLLKNNRHRKA